MLNTLISLKSYVGTIIVFVCFVITFIFLVATLQVPNIKFLLIPLTIGLGIALLNSVVYLNDIIRMKEGTVSSQNDPIDLKTCPEYWVKDTMKVGEDFVDICKNYNKIDEYTTKYVGGSTRESSSGSFYTNFIKDGDTSSNVESLLSTMNGNSDTIIDEDTFIDGGPTTYFDDRTDSNNGVLRTPPGHNELKNKVTYMDAPSNVDGYGDSNLQEIPGHHYHYISSMIHHDNTAAGHAGMQGAKYHSHAQSEDTTGANTEMASVCSSNWICEYDNGIVINLDELNTQSNNSLCSNARNFYWVEADNKCNRNRVL